MTDRLTINGWTVYLQERPNGAVATVREAPWSRSQPQSPRAAFVAASPLAALRHAETWIQQQPAEANSCRTNAPEGSDPEPWRCPEAEAAPGDALHQARLLEARRLLGAIGISDRLALKKHFRGLAMTKHPDHGGSRSEWDRLHGAYKFLEHHLKPVLPDSYDSQITED